MKRAKEVGLKHPRLILAALLIVLMMPASLQLAAQNKGEPGKFDFYLLNMPWGPAFCSIAGVSAQCKPQRGFVVHGLWPQNNDGSYPVFCSNEPGPIHPEANLDITPDLKLLQHEWAKHGTCSDLGAKRFFDREHEAYYSINIPAVFDDVDHELMMSPDQILKLFYKVNPQLPERSLLVSCEQDRFTAIEACFTTSLKPMPCLGLHSCAKAMVSVSPGPPLHH